MFHCWFLIFTRFWLFLHVGNIKLFCTSKSQNKNNSVYLCHKSFQILLNFQKSTNNFMTDHGLHNEVIVLSVLCTIWKRMLWLNRLSEAKINFPIPVSSSNMGWKKSNGKGFRRKYTYIPSNLSIQRKQIQSRVIYIIEFQFPCPRFPGTRT